MFGSKKKSKSHASHVHYFRTLKGVVGMLRNPHHTDSVFDIEDGLKDIEAYELAVQHLKQDPDVAQIIRERYLAGLADVDELAKLPDGSLGREYARHLRDHGYDPDYFRKIHVRTDLDYVLMRIRATHDIWHVVTGIGPDPIGELALKAVELAQLRRPMAAVITAGGVMRYMLKTPEEFEKVLTAISQGYQLGLRARPLLAQRWETGWDRPLADWREELHIEVVEMPVGRESGDDAEPGELEAGAF